MVFNIDGSVAIVTGGASGIGLSTVRELLKNGAKAVTIVDINEEAGVAAIKTLEADFDPKRVLFVKANIVDRAQFEEAFKKTLENFGNIDILFNNAGINRDSAWEQEIEINVKGTTNGILLGLDNYIKNYKSGDEGVIINTSSTAGINEGFQAIPVYVGTKFAITGMSLAFGHEYHYKRTGVRLFAICPGGTETPLLRGMPGNFLGEDYEKISTDFPEMQSPDVVARGVVKLIKEAKTATIWVIEDGNDPYEFKIPGREQFKPTN